MTLVTILFFLKFNLVFFSLNLIVPGVSRACVLSTSLNIGLFIGYKIDNNFNIRINYFDTFIMCERAKKKHHISKDNLHKSTLISVNIVDLWLVMVLVMLNYKSGVVHLLYIGISIGNSFCIYSF